MVPEVDGRTKAALKAYANSRRNMAIIAVFTPLGISKRSKQIVANVATEVGSELPRFS